MTLTTRWAHISLVSLARGSLSTARGMGQCTDLPLLIMDIFEKRWGGYEQTRCSNMSAEVSILVNKKLWKPKHVVRMFDAPQNRRERVLSGIKTSRKTSLRC